MFLWLKNYLPRSLYGRAALIVALPFLALQIVISIVFIQRHFEDVTRQMVDTTSLMLTQAVAVADAEGVDVAMRDIGAPLGIVIDLAEGPPPDSVPKLWYDISGFTIIARLSEREDLQGIDLSNIRRVKLWLAGARQTYLLEFPRTYMSARNPHQLLVLMVVAGLVMIAVAFIYLRNQLRPITRLARAAEAFGRGRMADYSPAGATEVRAAGAAFLDMRARIERQIEQRTLLLSGVSHDLRTPLTRMRLALSMMDGEDAKALQHDVDDMGQMIDAFLDFARVGANEEAQRTDLTALLRTCLEDAERAGRPVELLGELPAVTMAVRPLGLRRSVDNLLSNAARFGTRVRLSCTQMDRALLIRVEDNGPGIPEKDRVAATRPFTRLDPARGQNQGGSVGLGLAIAADTARRHGGALRLSESEDLGGLCADLLLAR